MRVCEECGKANQDLRKYCIRCGSKLVKATKPIESPKAPVRETGKLTTKATYDKEEETAEAAMASDSASVTTEDRWVRPSEVSRDRVRKSEKSRGKTELEKAQEAFRRADQVGFDEPSSGVVESRMLRASDVRGLLEEQEAQGLSPEVQAPPAETLEGSESVPPPSPKPPAEENEAAEEKILGSHSAIVRDSMDARESEELSRTLSSESGEMEEFRSAKYGEVEEEYPVVSAVDKESEGLEYEELSDEETVEVKPEKSSVHKEAVPPGTFITCPNCGEVIAVDSFVYPPEIYSAMGHARLKQARFFVVQGKYDEASRIGSIARSLFSKAEDESGLKEVSRLVDSMLKDG
ncbi:hypothetical protein EU538_05050 [Candidatus Thorarchaeota archaeon]|nr:MAG: hypothetical protein EU538_05050 [Candidatus Thorarchaeota archaeon]